MARTKGLTIGHVERFSKQRFGERGWLEVLSKMSPSDQQLLAAVVAVGWYDLELYARLIPTLDERHGRGDFSGGLSATGVSMRRSAGSSSLRETCDRAGRGP